MASTPNVSPGCAAGAYVRVSIDKGELPQDVIEAAGREREVTLKTYGRKSGQPHRVTI